MMLLVCRWLFADENLHLKKRTKPASIGRFTGVSSLFGGSKFLLGLPE
jgi:hypothetical protein